MNNLPNNEFGRYVTHDTAPLKSICESKDCDNPAAHRYLVTAGIFHCNNGLFCGSCGEIYSSRIERISRRAKMMVEFPPKSVLNWVYWQIHDGTFCEQGAWKTEEIAEEHGEEADTSKEIVEKREEEIYTWKDYLEWLEGRFAQG